MKLSFKHLVAAVGISILAVGCGSQKVSPEKPTATELQKTNEIMNHAANEVGADRYVEVSFDPGSQVLTESSKEQITGILKKAEHDGKLREVRVLSWADDEFPSKEVNELSATQRNLADERNQAIERYVKSVRNVSIDKYNMAKQPNSLQKLLNTTDAKLKNSLVAAGLPTTADNPQFPGKASHAVIFVSVQ